MMIFPVRSEMPRKMPVTNLGSILAAFVFPTGIGLYRTCSPNMQSGCPIRRPRALSKGVRPSAPTCVML
eukprot:592826-Prorocentrum_lima.AAC.1